MSDTLALSLRGLTKTYGRNVQALRGVDLDVAPGEFFALLGPNGAGKSTIIGIVSTLVRKSGGSVSVFGHDLDRSPWQAKREIGLVPQEFNFNGFETVWQIVLNQAGYYGIPRARATARAERYLRELDLWGKRNAVSRTLSGGMKRRLMIARALVHEPRLLILDEPTAGVDIELRRSMWQFLRNINAQGTTIILTTHYLEEAESLCRHIAIIDEGRIIENTDVRSLLRQLSTQSFILDVSGDAAAANGLDAYQPQVLEDGSLEVVLDRSQNLTDLFAQLQRQGVRVDSMKNKANRLEELFVRMLEKDERDEETA